MVKYWLAAVVMLTGCGGTPYIHPNVTGDIDEDDATRVFELASFDFACPVDQIHLIERSGMGEIGASGCGKRAIYDRNGYSADLYYRVGEVIHDGPPTSDAETTSP